MKRWLQTFQRGTSPAFDPTVVVVGLGNPGQRYAATRHNLGFQLCERLSAQGEIEGLPVCLVKPQTFVNASGDAVKAMVSAYQLDVSRFVVVHDDIDLEFGRVRVRAKGTAGGHNGVQSILAALHTDAVIRIKIGIGRPPIGVDPATYVLEPFLPYEISRVTEALERAESAVRMLVTSGIESTMQHVNQSDVSNRSD
jgi:PTH1 family peptidyl-tRNA hydrolase